MATDCLPIGLQDGCLEDEIRSLRGMGVDHPNREDSLNIIDDRKWQRGRSLDSNNVSGDLSQEARVHLRLHQSLLQSSDNLCSFSQRLNSKVERSA